MSIMIKQIAERFPEARFTGLELELRIEDGKYQAKLNDAFYDLNLLGMIVEDLNEANKFLERMRVPEDFDLAACHRHFKEAWPMYPFICADDDSMSFKTDYVQKHWIEFRNGAIWHHQHLKEKADAP